MIYFDNAATSWPKPDSVWQAMEHCIKYAGANPGRSGHEMSIEANKLVTEARELLAALFNIQNPDRIVFTVNATEALNLAIKGLLKPGDHVITSSMEHNSVTRPLHVLSETGVVVTKVPCGLDGKIEVSAVEAAICANTAAIVMTHASNVSGTLMPVDEIGRLARKRGLKFIVDAAQTAGLFDIDVQWMKIDLLAFPGHKSLLGPTGTGGLYIGENIDLVPLKVGGTGSMSKVPGQPDVLPEKYESGTLNTVGIAGLAAGLKFLRREGISQIREHEMKLTGMFLDGAAQINGLNIYGPQGIFARVPVVSFCFEEKETGKVGTVLDQRYKIACRAGLHCAPDAHRTLGTVDKKLLRFSFSYFNNEAEINYALKALAEIAVLPPKEFAKEEDKSCGC